MRIAVLLLVGVGLQCAQTPRPADQARALLQSPVLRNRAWGAWYAGASHDPALAATLIKKLEDAQTLRNSPRDGEEYAYVQSLFDALIQLAAPVPTAVMMPFEDSWRTEILILMNLGPPNGDAFVNRHNADFAGTNALIAMREHQMPEEQFAAVNDLLFALDAKTASRKVLAEIRVTHEFCVTDQHTFRADDGSGGIGESTRHFPKGFPPVALYQIRTFPKSGDLLFAARPMATYYARIVVPTDGEVKWFEYQFHGASTSARQRTLEKLMSFFESRSKLRADEIYHPWTAVDWQGTEATAAEVNRLLDDQADEIRAVVQDMARRRFIEATGMRIPIAVTVRDCRRNNAEPMPKIGAVREVVFP
jgi:hypothetical protein